MAFSRATLDNSSECWSDWIKRSIGIRNTPTRRAQGYRLYHWDEIVKHDKPGDCWIVIHGRVYDVTDWVDAHPGGKIIYEGAGSDCTEVWESYHPLKVVDKGVSKKYLIGEIEGYENVHSWDGSFYKTVKQRVEEAVPKQLRREDPQIAFKGLFLSICYFISLGLYIYFCTWWSAIIYGVLCSQIGLISVEHKNDGVFTSLKTLTWLAGCTPDLASSRLVYKRSHEFHGYSIHDQSNFSLLRLHMNQRRFGIHKYQQIYAWLLYITIHFGDLFGTFNDFFWVSNSLNLRGSTSFSDFVFQIFVKFCWFLYTILIPCYLHGYINIFPIWLLYMTSFGAGYALFFAINHWVLEAGCVDSINNINWGVLKAEYSINFAIDSKFWTWLTGGLNHQIEHNLFPAMVHTRLPEIAKIVQSTCKEFEINYFSYPTFWDALKAHYRLLKALGNYDKPEILKKDSKINT